MTKKKKETPFLTLPSGKEIHYRDFSIKDHIDAQMQMQDPQELAILLAAETMAHNGRALTREEIEEMDAADYLSLIGHFTQLDTSSKPGELPSGKKVQVLQRKAKHLIAAQRKAGKEPQYGMVHFIADNVLIDGKKLIFDDVLRIKGADALYLLQILDGSPTIGQET